MTEEDQDSSDKVADAAAKPATTEPATTERETTEPATTEPAAAKPATAEPATAEPATAEPATVEPATTVKKSKKRRKNKVAAASRSELDAEGRERPQFLLDFPHDPQLEPVIAAFEAGNYAGVREAAPRLIEHSEQAEVKAAARELLDRIEPDPLVKFLLAVAIALFVVVVLIVYNSHG